MALQAYLKLTGESQGPINGGITQKGREDSIGVIAVSHSVVSPRDSASGKPTGKRMHKPFVITKELDKATPLLYNALVKNENITKWELKFYTPDSSAVEKQHYTVELVNANITSIDFRLQNNKIPEWTKFPETEEIAFTYQKIIWTFDINGAVTAEDDWETPV